jgi:hypothetical protein
MTKTKEELDDLKAQWKADPCWDIADTEGFEDHKEELQAYQDATNIEWRVKENKRLVDKAFLLGCTVQLVQYIERLEDKIVNCE